MVGARAPGTEQISQLASKQSKMVFFEGCPVGWGGYKGGVQGLRFRGVGAEQISTFLTRTKNRKIGCPVGGFTHRSWPGGQGGRPRALVAGEGWGGA